MGLATRDYFGTLRKVFLPKMTAFHFPKVETESKQTIELKSGIPLNMMYLLVL
jgi:hypothetical protein